MSNAPAAANHRRPGQRGSGFRTTPLKVGSSVKKFAPGSNPNTITATPSATPEVLKLCPISNNETTDPSETRINTGGNEGVITPVPGLSGHYPMQLD
jgi:hypothetical protein